MTISRKGMSQVMTIILTTVIATMIAAIIGLSAGDIIPGAFDDTEHQSCVQQIQTKCNTLDEDQLSEEDPESVPMACRGVTVNEITGFTSENFEDAEDEDTPSNLVSCPQH